MRRTRRNNDSGIVILIILVVAAIALAPVLGIYYCFKCKGAGGKTIGAILAVLGFCGWALFYGQLTNWLLFILLAEMFLAFLGWEMLQTERGTGAASQSSHVSKQVTAKPPRFYEDVNRIANGGSFDPLEDLEDADTAEDYYLFNRDQFTNFEEAEEAFEEQDD